MRDTAFRGRPGAGPDLQRLHQDLAAQQRDLRKLCLLVREDAPLGTVLRQQAISRYLDVGNTSQAARRYKQVTQQNRGALAAYTWSRQDAAIAPGGRQMATDVHGSASGRQAGAVNRDLLAGFQGTSSDRQFAADTLAEIWHSFQYENVLEATATPVDKLYRAYTSDTPPPGDVVFKLTRLSDTMKMLRHEGRTTADFFYPAIRLMYERDCAATGTRSAAGLLKLLKNLPKSDNAASLARMRRNVEAWFLCQPDRPADQNMPAAVAAKLRELQVVFDGMAGAALSVLGEHLQQKAAGWGEQIGPQVFEEARMLHASAEDWHRQGLHDVDGNVLFTLSPPQLVLTLAQASMAAVQGQQAVPYPGQEILTKGLAPAFMGVAAKVDRQMAEWRLDTYLKPEDLAAWRHHLLEHALNATGLPREVDRLQKQPAPLETQSVAAQNTTSGQPVFRTVAPRPERNIALGVQPAVDTLDRRFERLLLELQNQNPAHVRPLSSLHIEQLVQSRRTVLRGGSKAGIEWEDLLVRTMTRYTDGQRAALDLGAFHAHIMGRCNLCADIADKQIKSEATDMLKDMWLILQRVRTQRLTAKPLNDFLNVLRSPAEQGHEADFASTTLALYSKIQELREPDRETDTLLYDALRDLGDAQLGELAAGLARRSSQGAGESAGLFIEQLYRATRAQVELRTTVISSALAPGFRAALFEEADRIHALLDTPAARAVNGEPHEVLGRLVREAAQQARADHESRRQATTEQAFLRTADGYTPATLLTRKLRAHFVALYAQLNARLATLNAGIFTAGGMPPERRDRMTDSIMRQTGFWTRLEEVSGVRPPGFQLGKDPFIESWSLWRTPAVPATAPAPSQPAAPPIRPARPRPAISLDRRASGIYETPRRSALPPAVSEPGPRPVGLPAAAVAAGPAAPSDDVPDMFAPPPPISAWASNVSMVSTPSDPGESGYETASSDDGDAAGRRAITKRADPGSLVPRSTRRYRS
jgi:hypothetical protein